MSLIRVIESECKTSQTGCEVVLEADSRDVLAGPDARAAAMEYARSKGFAISGLGNLPSPYPVNAEGRITPAVLTNKEPVGAYRVDYIVQAKLF